MGNETADTENVRAVLFACACFGLGSKELQLRLDGFRKDQPQGYRSFPKNISRMLMSRAKDGPTKHSHNLLVLGTEALYDRLRRKHGKHCFTFSGDIAERITSLLLKLHKEVLPKLDTKGIDQTLLLKVLVEEVFVPTIHIELVQCWREGLGNEFCGSESWYLPRRIGDRKVRPVANILDRWLRTAGFKTAYGVSRDLDPDSLRRRLDRWLGGEEHVDMNSMLGLVDQFASNVEWLDEVENWRSRFILASAAQEACNSMDSNFARIRRDYSFSLVGQFQKVLAQRIVCDTNKILATSETFFAARLVQLHLKRTRQWGREVESKRRIAAKPTKAAESSQAMGEAWNRNLDWRLNAGNWLLAYMTAEDLSDSREFLIGPP